MLTIFIDREEYNRLNNETMEKLKETYTSGGRVKASVIGHTFAEHNSLRQGEYIEINSIPYEIVGISRTRLFGREGESMSQTKQIFLIKDKC